MFVTLEDGTDVSVNATEDAVDTGPAATPIPGHQARTWTFVKDADIGTSVAHGLVSWDAKDPADYLMAGWWAQFPDQRYPDLDFAESIQHALVDGPEIDPAAPPRLPLHPAPRATRNATASKRGSTEMRGGGDSPKFDLSSVTTMMPASVHGFPRKHWHGADSRSYFRLDIKKISFDFASVEDIIKKLPFTGREIKQEGKPFAT